MRVGLTFRGAVILAFVLATITGSPGAAPADEPQPPEFHHTEQWTGFAATKNSFYLYSGATFAPFDTLAGTGFRLRAGGGYGGYYYDGSLNIGGQIRPVRFSGGTYALEALLGYQFRAGNWTGKLFGVGLTFRGAVRLAFVLATITGSPGAAPADEPQPPEFHHTEQWTGFAATKNSFYLYSGATFAPFDTLAGTGFRLRAGGGYGGYYYDGSLNIGGQIRPVRFSGGTYALEALLGYQFRAGNWTGKLFAGIDHQEHILTPYDPQNTVTGSETGVKAISENWINLGPGAWASLDGFYSTSFNSYDLRFKTGRNLTGPFDIGFEIGAFGNKTLGAGRAGFVARYKADLIEISITGGIAGDYDRPSNPYGNITALRKF